MSSYDVFASLLSQHHIKATDVSKAVGIRSGVFSDWKAGRYTPKADKLQKIADYFGVSLEYLMTGLDEKKNEGYYLDDDAKDYAQFLFEHPEYRILFDATRKVKKEDFKFVKEFFDKMNRE